MLGSRRGQGGGQRLRIGLRCLALGVVELRARFLQLLHVDVAVTFLDTAIREARLVEARFILLGGNQSTELRLAGSGTTRRW